MNNLKNTTIKDLLKLQSSIVEELISRGVLRTGNNPAGDLAEYLFCKTFDWKLETNSQNGFDATNNNNIKYQIKSRRLIRNIRGERLLSDFRDLELKKFDFLAGILFNADFSIYKAAIVPHQTVVDKSSSFSQHSNAHKFYLCDNIWELPNTQDVTNELQSIFNSL